MNENRGNGGRAGLRRHVPHGAERVPWGGEHTPCSLRGGGGGSRGWNLEEGGAFWAVLGRAGITEQWEGSSTGRQLPVRGPESMG